AAEVDAGVAPGEGLDHVHDGLRGQAVAVAGGAGAEAPARAQGLVPHVVDELPGHGVLALVELAGLGAHEALRRLAHEAQPLLDLFPHREGNHQTIASPSLTTKPRPLRSHISTG